MPYVQESMKELNRMTVFELVAEHQQITRAELAEQTRSSMPTILKITNFLQEQKIVSPVGCEITARGRRPQVLRFEPDALLSIGISYDGHHAVVSLVNYYGTEKKCVEKDVCRSFDDMMETEFPEMIGELLVNVPLESVKSIGVCIGGSVDTEHSKVHLGGFSKLKMEKEAAQSVRVLSERTGLPVYLFNDVNAAAVGEYILRKMKRGDLVYIYVGEGTGAGIILDGVLRTGQHFYTGEIAHMVFDPEFVIDISKPGWMEKQLSMKQIENSAFQKPDIVDYTARYISLMIANICNVMDIENVVLGGETVQKMGSGLLKRTEDYLSHLLLFPVKLTRFVNVHSELIGASFLALERQLTNILADND